MPTVHESAEAFTETTHVARRVSQDYPNTVSYRTAFIKNKQCCLPVGSSESLWLLFVPRDSRSVPCFLFILPVILGSRPDKPMAVQRPGLPQRHFTPCLCI